MKHSLINFCLLPFLGCGVRFSRRVRGFFNNCAGNAAIEFGMAIPIFLLFVFGTVEVGRFMWSEHALNYAADQAARFALANPSASNNDVKTYAESQVMTVKGSEVTVTVANELLDGIDYLNVTVTYPFQTLLPYVPLGPYTLTRVSRIPLKA